jgi:uncharacterized membrane protein YqjE
MESTTDNFAGFGASSKHFARRLLTMGENRLELLMVEVQEARERLLHAFLLALGATAFGFLALAALTGAILVLLWHVSPGLVLLALAGLYGVIAVFLFRRLATLRHDWQTLPATLDQFRKDRVCLENILE